MFSWPFKQARARGRAPSLGSDAAAAFGPGFERQLETLVLMTRRLASGRMRAERRSRRRGGGLEFADHREYVPGDDVRHLDINALQRLDRLWLRVYEEEEDLSVFLLIDCSPSMWFGAKPKIQLARQLAAALGYIALCQLDRVSIVGLGQRVLCELPPQRGRNRIHRLLKFLRELPQAKGTALSRSLRSFATRQKRRGLVILLSDLYDPSVLETGLAALGFERFELEVIHLVDEADAYLTLSGELTLVDVESNEQRELSVTPELERSLAAAHGALLADAARHCGEHRIPYVAADVNRPFDELVLESLRRGGVLSR